MHPPKNRENDKIQLSPPVNPGVLNTYFLLICYGDAIIPNIFFHFWIILVQNAHNFDLLN